MWRKASQLGPLLEYSLLFGHIEKCGRMRRETQRLLGADAEKPLMAQRVAEQSERAILKFPVEIDEHVAAGDQLNLGEYAVGRETMVGKNDVVPQRLVEDDPTVSCRVVVGQRRRRTRFLVIGGEAGDPFDAVDAGGGSLQAVRVDIRRVDERLRQQFLLMQQNGQRVGLFSGTA